MAMGSTAVTKRQLASRNEWELAFYFMQHLKFEEYEQCQMIKDEVARRIRTGTLCTVFAVDGFRDRLTGEPDYSRPNGVLYRDLPKYYPHLFTRKAADEYRLTIPANKVNLRKLL